VAAVHRLTSGRKGGPGVDAAFDAIGGGHFGRSFASLAKGGLLVGYGSQTMAVGREGLLAAGLGLPRLKAWNARGHAGPCRLRDADNVIAWREWQWPFEVRISAATDEGIGEASPGGEHLDPDLAGTRCRNGLLFRQFQDFGTTEPRDTDMLPRHPLTVSAIVVGVMLNAAGALTGSSREYRLRVDLNRSPRRRRTAGICAKPTVDPADG
jgi:hypothetical protein